MPIDYNAVAELFLAKRTKSSRENYRRFATAAETIRYTVSAHAQSPWREASDYPLRKPE